MTTNTAPSWDLVALTRAAELDSFTAGEMAKHLAQYPGLSWSLVPTLIYEWSQDGLLEVDETYRYATLYRWVDA